MTQHCSKCGKRLESNFNLEKIDSTVVIVHEIYLTDKYMNRLNSKPLFSNYYCQSCGNELQMLIKNWEKN